ncbi:Hypothetical protein A7982_00669 [Minicystis rosea]|nr:Hypothetical protein A7982_00669 [Minicystis rosea]
MSDENIHEILEELPEKSMTTRLLGALDYIVPGEWQNITSFEGMIRHVTGEEDQELIQRVGERAIMLYKDPDQGYQRAVQIFRLVDDTSGLAGMAAMARKIGEGSEWLGFLANITPKADTTQAVDAGVKLVAELAAFCYCNGLPGDSVGDFASALASYEKEESMRLAAWIACDCMIPLGPDFLTQITDLLMELSDFDLSDHPRFARIMEHLPGVSIGEKRQLLKENLGAATGAITNFVESKGIEREGVLARVKDYLEIADHRLDYVAAGIDLATNYFEHTGIQTVARRVIARAYGEI